MASILLIAAGDNPHRLKSEAAFAALCGVSPVEASSGKVSRHRLNQAYAARRRAEGKSARDILRCLKRYIAREVYVLITRPHDVADPRELRIARVAAGVSLKTAAAALDTWPIRISELERGVRQTPDLMTRYRTWLADQVA